MNCPTRQAPPTEPNKRDEEKRMRIRQLRVMGWTAGVIAVFAVVTFGIKPAWQFALGVAAVEAMVAVYCFWILKRG
jgi:hypothetical protein